MLHVIELCIIVRKCHCHLLTFLVLLVVNTKTCMFSLGDMALVTEGWHIVSIKTTIFESCFVEFMKAEKIFIEVVNRP